VRSLGNNDGRTDTGNNWWLKSWCSRVGAVGTIVAVNEQGVGDVGVGDTEGQIDCSLNSKASCDSC
jgi:hypothetical protein